MDTPLEEQEQDFGIWPENQPAVSVFGRSVTLWKRFITPFGSMIYSGLDYTSFPFLMRACGIADENVPDVFYDIQIMEMAALPLLNNRA